MATSSELYQQKAALEASKAAFEASVEAFLSVCKTAQSKANSVHSICMGSNDTNLRNSANTGAVNQMKEKISLIMQEVSSKASTASANAQKEINTLDTLAKAAAIAESIARKKAQQDKANNTSSAA